MEKQFAHLQHIINNEPITTDTHGEFLYHLQQAVLLALQEQGTLNAVQYRYAEENLKQQRRTRAKAILDKEIHR